jgi:hypothetical protein
LEGTHLLEDTVYSYEEDGDMEEPQLIKEDFKYYTEVKVDSLGNRAMQTIWQDEDQEQEVSKVSFDFENARVVVLNYDSGGGSEVT